MKIMSYCDAMSCIACTSCQRFEKDLFKKKTKVNVINKKFIVLIKFEYGIH